MFGCEIRSEAMRMESWRLNKKISFVKRKHDFPAPASRSVMNVNELQTLPLHTEPYLHIFHKAYGISWYLKRWKLKAAQI